MADQISSGEKSPRVPKKQKKGWKQSLARLVREPFSTQQRQKIRAAIDGTKERYETFKLYRAQRGFEAKMPFTGGRDWRSDIPFAMHYTISEGIRNYKYRGVRCLKHPIELALYMSLIGTAKPKTIFEIGSKAGGSALWMADQMRTFEIDGRIISIDITPPTPPFQRSEISFLLGDAGNLGDCLSPEFLAGLPRPWLVIEDSSHQYEDTLAVLRFFDPHMQPGEYLVVEDGNVLDMGRGDEFNGGPGRGISEFLLEAGTRYQIDAELCDFFGHNVTGNPNGYLRRTTAS